MEQWGQISGGFVPHISDVWAGMTQSWAQLGLSPQPPQHCGWVLKQTLLGPSIPRESSRSSLVLEPPPPPPPHLSAYKSHKFTSPVLYLQSNHKDPKILAEGENMNIPLDGRDVKDFASIKKMATISVHFKKDKRCYFY